MLHVKLDTGFNIEVEFTLPAFFKRFLAWIIDIVIMIAYYMIFSRVLNELLGISWLEREWITVLFGLPPLFYHLLCEIFLNGQSVGKKAMRIKVISADGGEPSVSQYLIRWVFRMVDLPWWILPSIGYAALPWWTLHLFIRGPGLYSDDPALPAYRGSCRRDDPHRYPDPDLLGGYGLHRTLRELPATLPRR